jgi:hypothetical protein
MNTSVALDAIARRFFEEVYWGRAGNSPVEFECLETIIDAYKAYWGKRISEHAPKPLYGRVEYLEEKIKEVIESHNRLQKKVVKLIETYNTHSHRLEHRIW